ncbi:uncharacterized protein BJ212DRAFT_1403092, partial [Suillus subaureus]
TIWKHLRRREGASVDPRKVKDIGLKHDASWIIQTVVKYSGQKGLGREGAQSKYSKVCSVYLRS